MIKQDIRSAPILFAAFRDDASARVAADALIKRGIPERDLFWVEVRQAWNPTPTQCRPKEQGISAALGMVGGSWLATSMTPFVIPDWFYLSLAAISMMLFARFSFLVVNGRSRREGRVLAAPAMPVLALDLHNHPQEWICEALRGLGATRIGRGTSQYAAYLA